MSHLIHLLRILFSERYHHQHMVRKLAAIYAEEGLMRPMKKVEPIEVSFTR